MAAREEEKVVVHSLDRAFQVGAEGTGRRWGGPGEARGGEEGLQVPGAETAALAEL